jgi:hypothetical protein
MNALVLSQHIILRDIKINNSIVGFFYIITCPKIKELPLGWTLTDDNVYHLALMLTDNTYYIDKTPHLTVELARAAADDFIMKATKTLVDYYNSK